MLEKINKWLEGPKRDYFIGVSIFEAAAAPEIKKKYLTYFKEIKGNPGQTDQPEQFDPHVTMLIGKVSVIANNWRKFPEKFSHVVIDFVEVSPGDKDVADIDAKISDLQQQIDELKNAGDGVDDEELEELRDQLDDSQNENAENQEKIEELEKQIELLKEKRGVSIVSYQDLPAELQKLFDRVREITPIMAAHHAEIAEPKLNHMRRKKLVKELIDYDDERRAAWDEIDAWAEGREINPVMDKPVYSDDVIVKGAQMARRVERLKENIARSQKTADESDRQNIIDNALKRVAQYQAELDELERIINAGSGHGDDVKKE